MRVSEWSGKRVLAILVSVDVLWHLFDIVVSPLGNELAVIISTGLTVFPQSLAVEVALQGVILFAAFYQAIPAVFEPIVGAESVGERFRVVAASQSTLQAVPLLVALAIPESRFVAAVVSVGVFVFTVQVFAFYYTHHTEDDLFTGEAPTQILGSLFGVSIDRDLGESTDPTAERSIRSSNGWRDTEYVAAGSIAAAPALYCLFLGVLGALGANTFPILESAIALWLVVDWLDGRRDLGPRSRKILHGSEELEARIYSYLNVLRSGREGLYGMLVVVLGFSLSVRVLQMGFAPSQAAHITTVLAALWQLVRSGASLAAFIVPLEQVSWSVIPVTVGLYNIWYWYRLLQRLSYAVNSDGVDTGQHSPQRLVRRPPMDVLAVGWFLFASTQFSALIAVARRPNPTGGPEALVREVFGIPLAYGYLWPVLFLTAFGSLLFRLSSTRRVYGVQRADGFPFVTVSRETVPRDPPQLGMPSAEDAEEPIFESEIRTVSILVAIAGYLGFNALVLLLGSLSGGVVRSVPVSGTAGFETASTIASLSWQPLLTYLYIGLGLLLLSVAIDRLPIDQDNDSNRILRLTDVSVSDGVNAPVFRSILWLLFAELSIAIVVVQLAFQTPLPLFAMLIGGPFALIGVAIFSFVVCTIVSRLLPPSRSAAG